MPDYIYLLENRLSHDQRHALQQLRQVAREAGTILFLTGDAVRDLTSGHAVRSLEVALHGNALKLKKHIEKLGGQIWGEHAPSQTLYLCFPGTVRVDLVSTHAITYPKPGKPVYRPASIQEDLHHRDFTVNAMALSLNEGSYGLLMDPMNGAADIETRTLRLVSNYGFIEDPSLLIRAIRYRTRLGWEMDPRTRARYEDARTEGLIDLMSPAAASHELEQIGHEDEALAILKALEAEGWMKTLFPAWTSSKADEEKLQSLHELAAELLMQGVHADISAAQMQLLTARMAPKDLTALKAALLRPGFVQEWNHLDAIAAAFSKVLLAKENATPSAAYRLFTSYDPEAVLWLGFTAKSAAVQERYTQFLKSWPEIRQQIPYAQMQEMRITQELVNYDEIVQKVFLELIDGHLSTPEEIQSFLAPFSPPEPPPQVSVKRSRPRRSAETKHKERALDDEDNEENEADLEDGNEDDLNDLDGDEEEELDLKLGEDEEADLEEKDEEAAEDKPAAPAHKAKATASTEARKTAAPDKKPAAPAKEKPLHAKPSHTAPGKPVAKPAENGAKQVKETKVATKGTKAPAKVTTAPAKAAKTAKTAAKATKAPAKPAAKPKVTSKTPAKPAPKKTASAAKTVAKSAAKTSPAAKPKPAAKQETKGKSHKAAPVKAATKKAVPKKSGKK